MKERGGDSMKEEKDWVWTRIMDRYREKGIQGGQSSVKRHPLVCPLWISRSAVQISSKDSFTSTYLYENRQKSSL